MDPHKEEQLKRNDFITDVVIGMSDGLIVPFVVVAGLSRIVNLNSTIIIAGVSTIAVGAVVMGFARYFTGKSNHHQKSLHGEQGEVKPLPGGEKQEVKAFFTNIGLSEEMQEKAIEEMKRDEKQWADLMMQYELETDNSTPEKAAKSALNTSLSYAIGGLVTAGPYFFIETPFEALKISAVLTLLSLLILGFAKGKVKGLNPWWGAIGMMLKGSLAAGAAFAIAKLFT